MKKQIISTLLSAACVLSSVSAFAEVTPRVIVDGSEIVFDDQAPVIEEGRTLIPARGVLEATGAKVGWYPTTKKVQVQSRDFRKIVEFIIDSDTMLIAKFKDDMISSDLEDVKLDVPAKVVNDRTLIPLRAVNDAFLYETTWDDETKTASVRTDRELPNPETDPSVYLTVDNEDVSEGDTFDVLVNIKNFKNEEERVINGATIGMIYDKTKLELEDCGLYNNETKINGMGASNPDFSDDSLKTATVSVDEAACLNTDGTFYKLTFKALADDCGTVALSNRYNSKLGYDTTFVMSKDAKGYNITPMDVYIDTTPLEIK